jgi:hypothetical protein
VSSGSGASLAGLVVAAACVGFAVGQRLALRDVHESSASMARELAELKRAVAEERSPPQCEAARVDVAAIAHAVVLELPPTTPAPAGIDAGAERRAAAVEEASPESARAFAEGGTLVDVAVQAGAWTVSDAQRLRELRARMTGEQREELTRKIVTAINAGTMTTNFRGGLF